jgi:hypothetical protein
MSDRSLAPTIAASILHPADQTKPTFTKPNPILPFETVPTFAVIFFKVVRVQTVLFLRTEHRVLFSTVGNALKVHKIENFFGFDFEICTFS